MLWETNEQKLCRMIHDRTTAAMAHEEKKFEEFQDFVKTAKAFEEIGLIDGLQPRSESCTGRRYICHITWKIPASDITSTQRQWLILRFFGTKGSNDSASMFSPEEESFHGLAGNLDQISRACAKLAQRGLIKWQGYLEGGGSGQITEAGIEALETPGRTSADSAPTTVHHTDNRNQSINVGTVQTGGGDLAMGHNATINKELLAQELVKLLAAIQEGTGTEEEKRSAVEKFKDFLKHPLLVAVTGGIAAAIGLG